MFSGYDGAVPAAVASARMGSMLPNRNCVFNYWRELKQNFSCSGGFLKT